MNTESLAGIFKALSEPIRLRILYLLLEKGELCVCDLMSTLGLSQSVTSRHLAYLRNHNIVKAKRVGVWMYYQLTENSQTELQLLNEFIKQNIQSCEVIKADLAKLSENQCCD
jgi:ArsR family transcriptional regulator